MGDSIMQRFYQQARSRQKRLVLPEGDDDRMLKAAAEIVKEKLASEVILIGAEGELKERAAGLDADITACRFVAPETDPRREDFAATLYELRKAKGMTEAEAKKKVCDPLLFGGLMVRAGVFDGLDAAMMVHPSWRNMTRRRSLTCYGVQVGYFGKPAHAGSGPDEGVNALDAMVAMFSAIGLLRQQLREDARVHGIITHGGDAANIIPAYTSAKLGVRAEDTAYATEVLEKVRACAEAGALATGARLEFRVGDIFY